MNSMTLRLPNNYVEVERDEMEYVDGGANYQKYWWGWAIDLSPQECGSAASLLETHVIAGGTGATLSGALMIAFPAAGVGALIASAVYGLNAQYVKSALAGCASQGRSATLCKNLSGYHINVW